MSYQDTLDYLYSRLPMFSRIGAAAIKKDLHNTIAICDVLGNPQHQFKTIHVAGTNGKGSTSHMLASILQAAGYKTGLYTSPHLYDFRERIKINGEMCSKEFVVDFTNKIKDCIESIEPSFFEITVGMAFSYFAQQKCDIAIIETGLGGRLDSTNIIHPELSIITNIGWDHMALLGNSLSEIAAEKAGIIKPGIPVIVNETTNETKPIFAQKALEQNAPIYFAEDIYTLTQFEHHWEHALFSFEINTITTCIECDLPGKYQYKNIKGVLVAISVLQEKGWNILAKHITEGLANIKQLTGLMGRWESIHKNPRIVLDVAHNEHGIHALLEQLQTLPFEQLHIVTGMVKDKDVDAVLQLLPTHAKYYFTQSHIPRALSAVELAEKGNALGLEGNYFEHVNIALNQAKSVAKQDDLILVIGSVFLVAEVDR